MASAVFGIKVSAQPSDRKLAFVLKCWSPGLGRSLGNEGLDVHQKYKIEEMQAVGGTRSCIQRASFHQHRQAVCPQSAFGT